MYHIFFQWGTSKEARAQVIIAGLKNPTPDVSRASAEVETTNKGKYPHSSHILLESIRAISYLLPILISPLMSLIYSQMQMNSQLTTLQK